MNDLRSFDPDFDDDDDEGIDGEPLKIEFDLPALLLAWQDESPDNSYYLDTASGAVKLVNPNLFDLKELTDEIERHKYRYLYLPKPLPGETKGNLRDFQKTVEDEHLVKILDMAFESPHTLDSFIKILSGKPEELARFRQFRQSRALLKLKQWLHANSLHDRWQIESPEQDEG
ncbi:MAG: hypothetical protein JSS86_10735 [Cyanobacteria bacterium SZAS LIN-2]|nr:hypothetical protein [Cyanobacteria bacterium SZAS LIN-3]MBS1996780.1 hypothetical protein [Cyanobacteria bacterium SZAS LIN-2]